MGYNDADGFYFYEEADIADPGAGFSDLLNKSVEALPAATRNLVREEISRDPAAVEAAIAAVQDAAASLLGLAKWVHLESGKWVRDIPNAASATHYVLPDHTGAQVVRATPFPIPSASAPELIW